MMKLNFTYIGILRAVQNDLFGTVHTSKKMFFIKAAVEPPTKCKQYITAPINGIILAKLFPIVLSE
ncbi:uncharacterized protein SPAPADRAFT_58331 [Spathaspora passalidarum NRRL Y-27907]|uniref:Uncharacterized protein n=1 Tax=Spathaspora passalidarum (strain NRRL Y-27907 / 11-Y1) TaxID=619300 RepID=G3AG05_SPAPN|nr:uncharacterized protein SPAPADRAFT_58331 [Spathaspora passalidarum NRRL Y-27907]EGW35144.1 hypothetical protein SPAPADRAFT_58331 [Spathaspora passalidarum NRRL Y-27907]